MMTSIINLKASHGLVSAGRSLKCWAACWYIGLHFADLQSSSSIYFGTFPPCRVQTLTCCIFILADVIDFRFLSTVDALTYIFKYCV